MLTAEHEYYIRFILLLLQVGTDLLREITKKALGRKNETLLQFLSSANGAIMNDRKLSKIQKDTLYPPSPQGPSFEDLDITLMSHLLINYLIQYVDLNEITAVNDIQKMRNNDYAHVKDATMDAQTFWKQWNKLTTIIKYVNTGMSPDVQKRHKDMEKHIKNDPLDITVAIEEIRKWDQSRDFFEIIQQTLENIQKDQQEIKKDHQEIKNNQQDIRKGQDVINKGQDVINKGQISILKSQEQLKVKVDSVETTVHGIDTNVLDTKTEVMQMKALLVQIKEQRENQGKITKIVHTIHGKVYLSADDQETIDHAEAAILQASNNSIAKKEPTDISHQTLQEKVALVVKDIENLDVKVEGASKGSIIFEFNCQSLTAILDLIDYFYSPKFQKRLDDIAQALEHMTGKKIYFTAVEIDRHSVKDIITKLQKKEYETVVQFELSCAGVDGLLHALEVFEEGKAANSLNELSKALSDTVGKPVTLHASIDIDQMKHAIQAIKDQFAAEDSQESSVRLPESKLGTSSTEGTGLNVKPYLPKEPKTYSEVSTESTGLNVNPYHLPKEPKTYSKVSDRSENLCFDEEEALTWKTQDLSLFEEDRKKAYKHETSTEKTRFNKSNMGYFNDPRDLSTEFMKQDPLTFHYDMEQTDDKEGSLSLVYQKQIRLNYHSYQDRMSFNMTTCALISQDRLLFAYQMSLLLAVVDIPSGSVIKDQILPSEPYDIAVLPKDQAAVTLPYNNEILIIDTKKLETVYSIPVQGRPSGITYLQGELYVLYRLLHSSDWYDLIPSLLVLNLKGDRLREVQLDRPFSYDNRYIAVSEDKQSMYITDRHALIRYSLHEERINKYQLGEMYKPSKPVMLADGSLLICCTMTGSIYHITAEHKQGYLITRRRPGSIGYDPDNQLLYMCYRTYTDIIEVFSLVKTTKLCDSTDTATSLVKKLKQYDSTDTATGLVKKPKQYDSTDSATSLVKKT